VPRAPDLVDMIEEVRREVAMRHHVYGLRVQEGRMNRKRADWQIEVMEAVLARLVELNGGNDGRPSGLLL
jgi:hypothetical protein